MGELIPQNLFDNFLPRSPRHSVLENGKSINANISRMFESLLQATNENMSLQHLFATS